MCEEVFSFFSKQVEKIIHIWDQVILFAMCETAKKKEKKKRKEDVFFSFMDKPHGEKVQGDFLYIICETEWIFLLLSMCEIKWRSSAVWNCKKK